jgi:glycine cleavage system H protein
LSDYSTPDENHYTPQDEWIREEKEQFLIGVTDFAQQQLGDIVFVELPEVGSQIAKDEPFGVIESVKAVSDLFAPISGTVEAVNEILATAPEQINEDCYGEGWLLSVTPTDDDEFETLLTAKGYLANIAERDA